MRKTRYYINERPFDYQSRKPQSPKYVLHIIDDGSNPELEGTLPSQEFDTLEDLYKYVRLTYGTETEEVVGH